MNNEKLLTISDVLELLQIKRGAFYLLRKNGVFPEAISLTGSKRSQRWLKSEVDEFIRKRNKMYHYMK